MIHRIQPLINTFSKKPRQLFFIDGLGALLTIFFLTIVLTTFQEYIGMPKKTLYFLSVIAVIYGIHSISCYFLNPRNWHPFLKIIAFANLAYCFITIVFIYYYFQNMTVLGLLYFFLELLVIFGLVAIELMVIFNQKNKQSIKS
ncbi:hypothetical protein [uncultured Aquimarina sp.]|uniref:hypothetical protein n=1 Tax=uncultured Aquimarina sp. TaxID=575652 RepID=UPI002632E147|nr:hypothetical protein [uncultured Aquimarina sp.]